MASFDSPTQLTGDLFLLTNHKSPFAAHQVELLKAIQNCGSISKAAKAVGISYKTAWDRIDAMNNMSTEPLVLRASGGAKGGGTQLTSLGERIISGFQSLLEEHEQFIARLGAELHSLQDVANFVSSERLNSSVRNQFRGQVSAIKAGATQCEVQLDIGISTPLVAIISQDSLAQLNLAVGSDCIALVNDSDIVLTQDSQVATSARNRLTACITRVNLGAVNSDISLDLGQNKSLSVVLPNSSVEAMALTTGQTLEAMFKAPNVILLRAD